jgi:hypothetical protein
MLGNKYNRLFVVAYLGRKYWLCICKCGNAKKIQGQYVRSGHIKSCGCLADEYRRSNTRKFNKSWNGIEEISGKFISTIKAHAKNRGRPYSVSNEYIWELYCKQNRKCVISGIPIHFPRVSTEFQNGTCSLDRIDSSIGYIEGNVQWVHKKVNIMKQSMSDTEFIKWCKLIAKYSA